MKLEDWPLSEPSLDEDGTLILMPRRWVYEKEHKELYSEHFC
jgi:hypothetical protein